MMRLLFYQLHAEVNGADAEYNAAQNVQYCCKEVMLAQKIHVFQGKCGKCSEAPAEAGH